MNTEKIKQIRESANYNCDSCGLSAQEFLNEYADLLESIDKAEPVAWMDEMGCAYSMLTYCGQGTKLYAHPPKQEQSPSDGRAEFGLWKRTYDHAQK